MNSFVKGTALSTLAGLSLAGSVDAAEILITGDIATSTTWTADNTAPRRATSCPAPP